MKLDAGVDKEKECKLRIIANKEDEEKVLEILDILNKNFSNIFVTEIVEDSENNILAAIFIKNKDVKVSEIVKKIH